MTILKRTIMVRSISKRMLRLLTTPSQLQNNTPESSRPGSSTNLNQISTASQNHIQKLSRARIKKYRNRKEAPLDPTSNEGVLLYELAQFAGKYSITLQEIPESLIQHYSSLENHRIIEELEILEVSSSGNGLALVPSEINNHAYSIVVVPFTTKGDVIRTKLGFHTRHYIEGHPLQVIKASKKRNDALVKCKNFKKCSGCQLQMLEYQDQLDFKTETVKRAYKRYGLEMIPISDTVGSPLQYHYRSKLTPHFNSNRKDIMIGFEKALGKGMINIDSCEIATPVLNSALSADRDALEEIVKSYKKSGTILLRDKSMGDTFGYTTNHREIITQKIGGHTFRFPAGEFFQNNNSILPLILKDIKSCIKSNHKTLIDTYCGSGFFGISLSHSIDTLVGIEISKGNLNMAQSNAELNQVKNSKYILGSSEEIFAGFSEIKPEETIVILDPPRKGSTESYLIQLSNLRPDLIVYVSCNVFSQARDIEFFLNNTSNGAQYEVQMVKGYDFFPQTRHVETLVVLRHCK